MSDIEKIFNRCKGGCNVFWNPHINEDKGMVEYIEDRISLGYDEFEDKELYMELIHADTICLIYAYTESPVGFVLGIGSTFENACKQLIKDLEL